MDVGSLGRRVCRVLALRAPFSSRWNNRLKDLDDVLVSHTPQTFRPFTISNNSSKVRSSSCRGLKEGVHLLESMGLPSWQAGVGY